MSPNELALRLNRIASAIDNSKSPSREAVLRDLRKVLASMGVAEESHMMGHEAESMHEAGLKDGLKDLAVGGLIGAALTFMGVKGPDMVHKAKAAAGIEAMIERANYRALAKLETVLEAEYQLDITDLSADITAQMPEVVKGNIERENEDGIVSAKLAEIGCEPRDVTVDGSTITVNLPHIGEITFSAN